MAVAFVVAVLLLELLPGCGGGRHDDDESGVRSGVSAKACVARYETSPGEDARGFLRQSYGDYPDRSATFAVWIGPSTQRPDKCVIVVANGGGTAFTALRESFFDDAPPGTFRPLSFVKDPTVEEADALLNKANAQMNVDVEITLK